MSGPMIAVRGVTKRFENTLALDRVDLDVRAGEFLTLLGPSGCGKTTLLRLISGFETPDAGSVAIDGVDVANVPPHKRPVNQVFQSYALFPHMTVAENVAFGLRMRKAPRNEIEGRVKDALALVDLSGLDARLPSALSGGQRQRVALARALVLSPKVLLLDEPLSALDARLRRAMQLELKHLQRRLGITFVFVTHDQDEALSMSDRIAVVNRGRIVQLATAEEIYRRPASRFVAGFVGDANLQDAVVTGPGCAVLADGTAFPVPPGAVPGPLVICVRPEDVRIAVDDGGTPDAAVFPAEVIEVVFRGPTAHVRARTKGGVLWTALHSGGGAGTGVHAGQRITLRIAADRIIPVAADVSDAAPDADAAPA